MSKEKTASDAAVAEVTERVVSVPFDGKTYSFKRKRIDSVQFRLAMQKRRDAVAVEWLLGPVMFADFLEATADEDGCTTDEVFAEFIDAIGTAVGAGNS